jgi:hypothetical protein
MPSGRRILAAMYSATGIFETFDTIRPRSAKPRLEYS